jgi:hypothetical protein
MGYRASLQWAADDDGKLVAGRLQRIARVRGYKPGWVRYNTGQNWQQVWNAAMLWRQNRR